MLFLNVTGELLNVEGVVKEKWLELEKFRQPSSDAADRKLLNTVNIELKLISRSCCMDMHFCILYLIYVQGVSYWWFSVTRFDYNGA